MNNHRYNVYLIYHAFDTDTNIYKYFSNKLHLNGLSYNVKQHTLFS